MNLAKRTITSITWKVSTNFISLIILFIRSVLLARWLPIDVFGIYTFATAIIGISVNTANFGTSGAFLNRSQEVQDETQLANVFFTIKLISICISTVVLITLTLLFTSGQLQMALLFITVINIAEPFTLTSKMILVRRVWQRRLAIIQLLTSIIATIISLTLVWQGFTLWALLVINFINVIVNIIVLFLWRPVWKPHIAWSPPIVRYFFDFGGRNFISSILYSALDRIDDLWTGFYLGETPLGLYSRAYSFASYPRKILAIPINLVIGGAYAELKGNRKLLSKVFIYTNILLIRSGFFLGGLLVLVAPEFIEIVLGEKWLPMLNTFRLMLVFTVLDPIKITIAGVISLGGGKPEQVSWIRFVQLIVLLGGLFLLGPQFGITGVAIAVDVMLLLGIAILLWQARVYVDFSIWRLFSIPVLALIVSLVFPIGASVLIGLSGIDWRTALMKIIIFSITYSSITLFFERDLVIDIFLFLSKRINKS